MNASYELVEKDGFYNLSDPNGITWQAYLEEEKLKILTEEGEEALESYRKLSPPEAGFPIEENIRYDGTEVNFYVVLVKTKTQKQIASTIQNNDWEIICSDESGDLPFSPLEELFITIKRKTGFTTEKVSPVLDGYQDYLKRLASEKYNPQ